MPNFPIIMRAINKDRMLGLEHSVLEFNNSKLNDLNTLLNVISSKKIIFTIIGHFKVRGVLLSSRSHYKNLFSCVSII
jgi:hypothetical protein